MIGLRDCIKIYHFDTVLYSWFCYHYEPLVKEERYKNPLSMAAARKSITAAGG